MEVGLSRDKNEFYQESQNRMIASLEGKLGSRQEEFGSRKAEGEGRGKEVGCACVVLQLGTFQGGKMGLWKRQSASTSALLTRAYPERPSHQGKALITAGGAHRWAPRSCTF